MKQVFAILTFASALSAQPITWTYSIPSATFNVYRGAGPGPCPSVALSTLTKVGSALTVKTFTPDPVQFGEWCFYVTAVVMANGKAYESLPGVAPRMVLPPPPVIEANAVAGPVFVGTLRNGVCRVNGGGFHPSVVGPPTVDAGGHWTSASAMMLANEPSSANCRL